MSHLSPFINYNIGNKLEKNNIDYVKTCKAKLHFRHENKDHIIINTELLRFTNINLSNDLSGELRNSYIVDFLKNIDIKYFYNAKINEDFCPNSKRRIYIGEIEADNIVRDIEYQKKPWLKSNGLPDDLKMYSNKMENRKGSSYICEISKEYPDNKNKILQYPQYFIDLVENKSKEVDYLKNIDKSELFFLETDTFIIIPDIANSNGIVPDLIREYYKLINFDNFDANDDQELLFSILSKIKFMLLIKTKMDHSSQYKYRDIFSFSKDDLVFLENIKNTIMGFMKNLLHIKNEPRNIVDIFINSDTKYHFCVINFILFDNSRWHQYISFIDRYRIIDFDNFVESIKNGDKLSYYTRYSDSIINDNRRDNQNIYGQCKNDPKFLKKYGLRSQKGGFDVSYRISDLHNIHDIHDISDSIQVKKPNILEQIMISKNFDEIDIKILNEYSYGNKLHTYCSIFLIISVNGNIFEVSIKSITYKGLQHFEEFNKKFTESLKSVISRKAGPDYEYFYEKYNAHQKYYFSKLPGLVEIHFNKLDKYEPLKLHFVKEKYTDYLRHFNSYIKNDNTHVYISIITHLCWKSEYRSLYNRYFGTILDEKYIYGHLRFRDLLIYEEINKQNISNLLKKYSLKMKENIGENYDNIINFGKLTQKMLKHPIFGIYILDTFMIGKNITINCKIARTELILLYSTYLIKNREDMKDMKYLGDDILQSYINGMTCKEEGGRKIKIDIANITSLKTITNKINRVCVEHLLWYTPSELRITDYKKYEEFIDKNIESFYDNLKKIQDLNIFDNFYKFINGESRRYGSSENFKRNYGYLLNESTNFYEIYKKDDFVHNIRHLNPEIVNEIDSNIKKMEMDKGTNYITGVHHPNTPNFNVLHVHFYKGGFGRHSEISGNISDVFWEIRRFYFWDKNRNNNFRKDLILGFEYADFENIGKKHGQFLRNYLFL